MIKRHLAAELHRLLTEYPVVTVLGPRQAGKTTLARSELPDYAYTNLEQPETRQFARDDPKAFLRQFPGKVVLDEIQRVPELLSHIQVIVDEEGRNGRFVLTGSHQLALREAIGQSLAGRTALLRLYPLSLAELAEAGVAIEDAALTIQRGFLPRVHDQQQRPATAYSNYYQTYVERDVRQLINLRDSAHFERFMKLLAGRTGQLLDQASLANDAGVSARTIREWLSILEASFVVYRLTPWFENFGKRVVKAPKYYFVETGLLAFLLGIEEASQVGRDPLYGQMFENMVVMECLKARANAGKTPDLHFFRDSNGNEVDILLQEGRELTAIEIKSAATYSSHLLKGLRTMRRLSPAVTKAWLVYDGDDFEFSDGVKAVRFGRMQRIFGD